MIPSDAGTPPAAAPVFETFGCRLNAAETDAMRDLARKAGMRDAVVVNTCAVTGEAVRQARQRIRKLRRDHPGARLIVTGCAAQIEPETFAAMPEVDRVIGNADKLTPEIWRAEAPDSTGDAAPAPPRDSGGSQTRARACVPVQNGCDHRCTFCIIPFGRGDSRSVPAGAVVEQIERLVGGGCNEAVLTGVDLTSWGADLPGRPGLGDLVQRILRAVPDLPRLRLSSIDSIEADPALIEAVGGDPRLMPHLHLSLQSGDDMILKRMKRRHLRADSIRFCEEIRAARPDVVFGADLIAGFPTETEDMFQNTLRLVRDCGLTWLHVFPYSAREGTPAARMPQVPATVRRERARRLRAAGEAAVERHLAGQIGRTHPVLMETPRFGRTEQFAGVAFDADRPAGEIVTARILGRTDGRLRAARATL